jgi:aryl-alcohol dehydrogenase-like predicted oxidoreductase
MVFCLKKLHNKTDPSREREREMVKETVKTGFSFFDT